MIDTKKLRGAMLPFFVATSRGIQGDFGCREKEVEILCLNRIKKGKELDDGNLWPELDALGKMSFYLRRLSRAGARLSP